MPRYLVAYLATAVVFFAGDAAWLSVATGRFYRPMLGGLLAERPNLPIAALFYVVYVAGVVVFAVAPALAAASWPTALLLGALLGLVAYGTYDITNLATLRNWPLAVSLLDLGWGITLTAVSALLGYLVTQRLAG